MTTGAQTTRPLTPCCGRAVGLTVHRPALCQAVGAVSLWVALGVCLVSSEAIAGRLQNPLPMYDESGKVFELHFRDGGLEFQGRHYLFVGRNRYQVSTQIAECTPSTVGTQRFEVKLARATVTWSQVDVLGCQKEAPRNDRTRKTARRIVRTYQLERPMQPECGNEPFVVHGKKGRLTLSMRCDGTIDLVVAHGDGGLRRDFRETLSQSGRRFVSQGTDGELRWRLSATPPKKQRRERGWRIQGRIDGPNVRLKLRGYYRTHNHAGGRSP